MKDSNKDLIDTNDYKVTVKQLKKISGILQMLNFIYDEMERKVVFQCPFNCLGLMLVDLTTGIYKCSYCGHTGDIYSLANDLRSHIVADKETNLYHHKFLAQLDDTPCSKTPTPKGLKKIRNRLSHYAEFSPIPYHILMECILSSFAVSPYGVSDVDVWKGQQMVLFYFENKDNNTHCFNNSFVPTFVVHSPTSAQQDYGMIVGYCFKDRITNRNQFKAITDKLLQGFTNFTPDKVYADNNDFFCFNGLHKQYHGTDIVYSVLDYTEEQFSAIEDVLRSSTNN